MGDERGGWTHLGTIVNEPDQLEREYLASEGAREQTDEDPGKSYWKASAELGSWIMHWMTLGWFHGWAIHVHQERRSMFEGHQALCTTITVGWTSFDLAYPNVRPIHLEYVHWLLDPDVIGMLVWYDDLMLNANGLGRAISAAATDKLRQHLQNENLISKEDILRWSQQPRSKTYPTFRSSSGTNLIYQQSDYRDPTTHPRTSKSSDNS